MLLDFSKTIPKWEENPFKKNLIRFMTGQINKQEFQRELAYGAMQSINDLSFISPPERPKPLQDLVRMKKEKDWYKKPRESRQATEGRCFDLTEVKDYYRKLDKIKTDNASNEYWLKIYYQYIDKNDQVNRARILKVLMTHGVKPGDQKHPIQREGGALK